MCPRRTMNKENHNRDLLFRIGGLLFIALIGLAIMGCGLALAFNNYRLSMILFGVVVLLLVAIKMVSRWCRDG